VARAQAGLRAAERAALEAKEALLLHGRASAANPGLQAAFAHAGVCP
jgi:hypothetical protein